MSDKIKTDSKGTEMPVSRFWACVFSPTIFALLWTRKMGKTLKWIPIFALFIAVWFVIDELLYYDLDAAVMPSISDIGFYQERVMGVVVPFLDGLFLDAVSGGLLPDAIYSEDLVFVLSHIILVVYDLIIYIGSIALMIYFMFKWTTAHNLENFGYKSKREWKNATRVNDRPKHEIRKELKKYGESAADGMSHVASRVKSTGGKSIDNIEAAISKIRQAPESNDDEIIAKIRKWHDLMEIGVISESEFDDRKNALLGKMQENT